jgi:hypothetical protein
MDWFERITGFAETDYPRTQALLSVHDGALVSAHSATRWAVGTLETPTLAELRQRAAGLLSGHGRSRVSALAGDARALHALPENADALFQVASQFNLLEMTDPDVTPEDGVTRYIGDRTQGPACAIAAGAATIYRNYLAPVPGLPGQRGQRADAQIDCIADLGQALGNHDGRLWRTCNGYVLPAAAALAEIDRRLSTADPAGLDDLRGRLRIGLQWRADVTDLPQPGHRVSQALCSALPVAYAGHPNRAWAHFAALVLEATYEATLLAAAINRAEHGCSTVFLTRVGGGAFGNDTAWIDAAMRRALGMVVDAGLDVRLVAYRFVPDDLQRLADAF